jgi:hypothetical protein
LTGPAEKKYHRAMESAIQPKARLLSLDTLRGFDMFWIIGGDALFQALGDALRSINARLSGLAGD